MVGCGFGEVVDLFDVFDVVPDLRVEGTFPGLGEGVCDAFCAGEVEEEAGSGFFGEAKEDGGCAGLVVAVSGV